MSTLYTKREAALALGIDRNTLTKWARECGIRGGDDPRDKRLSLLSEEDLRTIRERYADRHTFSTSPAHRPQTVSVSSADLTARVAALEATIEQLRQRAPYLFTASTEARVATDVQLPPSVPPRRLTATTASHSRTSRPPIPEGMLGVKEWARQHRIPETTAKRHVKDGDVPAVHGEWQRGSAIFKQLLAAEGQAAAHRLWGFGDPCRVCGWSSERELPATSLAVVAGSYEVDDEGS